MIVSFSRASTRDRRQRGYALLTALILALLCFGLMELVLIECTEASRQAVRFRSKVVAQVLAQSAADLAAERMVSRSSVDVNESLPGGVAIASYRKMPDGSFEIIAGGTSTGPAASSSSMVIQGSVVGGNVSIVRTTYEP